MSTQPESGNLAQVRRQLDALYAEAGRLRSECNDLLAERDALQSLLTVARRLLGELYDAAAATMPGAKPTPDDELAQTRTLAEAFALTRRRRDKLRDVLIRVKQTQEGS
jgi:hypothetical protein